MPGLIDEMQKNSSVDAAEFAARTNLEPAVLLPLCEAFYCLGMFEKNGAGYALSEKGRDIVEVMRGWLEVCYGYDEVFHSLELCCARTRYTAATSTAARISWRAAAARWKTCCSFPWPTTSSSPTAINASSTLGCGDGTFLRALCGLNAEVECYGIDLAPSAVEEGNRILQEAGLAHRVKLMALDISKIDQAGLPPIDAATIFFVLHELLYFGEDVVVNFLKDFRRLFPNAPLIAFEALRPSAEELRKHPGISVYYFLYHDLTQQKPVDTETWKRLFRQAGFRSIEERQLDFAKAVIYTLR